MTAAPQTAPADPNTFYEALARMYAQGQKSVAAGDWAVGLKHDAPGSPSPNVYRHGPNGNFRMPGVDPAVFHTTVGNMGMLSLLPSIASTHTDPTYEILTGVTDESGNEAEELCDPSPVAGLIKSCITSAPFGRYKRQTQEIELTRLGQTVDRSDPMDLTVIGSPIANTGIFATGPGDPTMQTDVLRNETRSKFWELAITLNRLLSVQLWQGSSVNNTAGGGYQEMNGFDRVINTGYQDIHTGVRCPSADSLLTDFNYQRVDGGGTDLVANLTYHYRYARSLAARTGVDPVRWVFAMREELFYEVTAVWPCSYLTYRCEVEGNQRVNIDGNEQVRMTNEMRTGQYLLIDGVRVEVVLDDGIAAEQSDSGNVPNGCQASDIYLIPMSVQGGRATTFLEYMDFTNESLRSALATGLVNANVQGPWMTTAEQTRTCLQWESLTMPRLVFRTPWLATRLQNVTYCPVINTRQPFPDDPYYVNGGLTSREGPSYYDLWDPNETQ